jgi:uncharacterized protein YprB with RNaseH-like and TPR domain
MRPMTSSLTEFAEIPKARVLFFDLETDGVNALRADLGFVVCFGYKWVGERRTHCLTISEEDLLKNDDSNLLLQASKVLEQADIVVAHYGSVFDRRFFQGRLLANNLPPIPPTKMRDTCMIARSVANFSSNRLAHLADVLGVSQRKYQKKADEWPGWWYRVMRGDMEALKAMAKYCKQDVRTLEAVYERLLPFDNAHPRISLDRTKCAICGGDVLYQGVAYVGERQYRRYKCVSCKRWGRERVAIKHQ